MAHVGDLPIQLLQHVLLTATDHEDLLRHGVSPRTMLPAKCPFCANQARVPRSCPVRAGLPGVVAGRGELSGVLPL